MESLFREKRTYSFSKFSIISNKFVDVTMYHLPSFHPTFVSNHTLIYSKDETSQN